MAGFAVAGEEDGDVLGEELAGAGEELVVGGVGEVVDDEVEVDAVVGEAGVVGVGVESFGDAGGVVPGAFAVVEDDGDDEGEVFGGGGVVVGDVVPDADDGFDHSFGHGWVVGALVFEDDVDVGGVVGVVVVGDAGEEVGVGGA